MSEESTKRKLNGGNSAEAISAKEMQKGESVEGHIVRFIETTSKRFRDNKTGQFKVQSHPVLAKADGKQVILWAAGNLNYLQKDLAKNNVAMGTLLTITRAEDRLSKAAGKELPYFDIEVTDSEVVDPSKFAAVASSEGSEAGSDY